MDQILTWLAGVYGTCKDDQPIGCAALDMELYVGLAKQLVELLVSARCTPDEFKTSERLTGRDVLSMTFLLGVARELGLSPTYSSFRISPYLDALISRVASAPPDISEGMRGRLNSMWHPHAAADVKRVA